MALLNVSNLKKMFGDELLFDKVSFEVEENDHIGLVGRNGSGKTTLFRMLIDEVSAEDGDITFSKNTRIGYMEQHVCKNLGISAYDEVLTVFSALIEMEHRLNAIQIQLSSEYFQQNGTPEQMERLIEEQLSLQETYEANGGLTYRSRARSALMGLGFTDEQQTLRVGVLSGGQKAKLQLAKMLLCGANLLLLDEPTNHLDIQSVEWLEDFLIGFRGSYLVISHDRYFLDKVTNRTFEMENNKCTCYKGNYTRYLQQKEELRVAALRQYSNVRREIKRLEGIVEQQRQWNREKNIRTAESKLKMIDRLEENLEKPDDLPEDIHFNFQIRHGGSNDVLHMEQVGLSFGEKVLFRDVNLHIRKGERIFLLGPNGCGKTSLLKTILNIYSPTSGQVKLGTSVDLGYYDQIQSGLSNEKTVLDEIWDTYPEMTQTEVRSALAVFLYHGEDVFKEISALSGGEKARVLLLKLMLSRDNFLLLDEPTNHLDISSREALEEALLHYEGTLFVVSHDRYLINKIADRIYYLTQDGVKEYLGNYDYYLEHRAQEKLEAETKAAAQPKPNAYRQQKERNAELRKKRAQLQRMEKEISATEEDISTLEAMFEDPEVTSDYQKMIEINQQLEEKKAMLDEVYLAWMELNEEVSESE